MAIAKLASGLVMAAVLAAPVSAQHVPPEASRTLSCDFSGKETPAAHERKMLKAAPDVRRISAHVLQVNAKSGVRRFVDKKPYREELDGFHWTYCGYDVGLDAHLIGMEDGDLFS